MFVYNGICQLIRQLIEEQLKLKLTTKVMFERLFTFVYSVFLREEREGGGLVRD